MFSGLFGAFLFAVFLFVIPLVLRIKYAEHQIRKLQKERAKVEEKRQKLYQALNILQLPRNPTKRQIRDAHRSLMAKNHPDRGGSKTAAAQVNAARDVLMKEAA